MEENNIMTFTPQQLKDLGIYFNENQDSFELYFDKNGNTSYSQEQSIMITNHIIPETQETELTQSLSSAIIRGRHLSESPGYLHFLPLR